MSLENPLWGATKMHGDLLKLGIAVAAGSAVADLEDLHSYSSGRPCVDRSVRCPDDFVSASDGHHRGDPRSPWQNPYVERLIGSIRRECLDHVIILSERHLRRVLSSYFQYHHEARTHLSLDKDCPRPRAVQLPSAAHNILALPEVGGLHHRYERRAA
jgi:hypothetical protein